MITQKTKLFKSVLNPSVTYEICSEFPPNATFGHNTSVL